MSGITVVQHEYSWPQKAAAMKVYLFGEDDKVSIQVVLLHATRKGNPPTYNMDLPPKARTELEFTVRSFFCMCFKRLSALCTTALKAPNCEPRIAEWTSAALTLYDKTQKHRSSDGGL
jgi:hypothetical protein